MSKHVRPALYLAAAFGVWSLAVAPASGRQQTTASQSTPQPPPPDRTPPPTFKAGINFVRVDVIATDKDGKPVVNLKQSDFKVREDGKLQQIQTFQLIRIAGPGQVAEGPVPPAPIHNQYEADTEAAKDNVRLIAIFLDDYHVRRGNSMAVRAPLEKFVEQDLGPNDLVAVMYPLTPTSDLAFSANHKEVADAIEHFNGRKYNYQPMNSFEQQYADQPTSVVEDIRNQVSLSALKALVTYMGSLREGRKEVVLVSEGFTNYLPPQLRNPDAGAPGINNPAYGNPTAGENDPNEQTASFFSSLDIQDELRSVYNAANRNNTSIYTLDPRGLAGFEFDMGQDVGMKQDAAILSQTQDTLRVLADETGGRAIVNQNNMERGLRQLVKDASDYYLLGYTSTATPTDGKFHRIDVSVDRPGVTLRARKGYWALSTEETTQMREAKEIAARPGPGPAVEHALSSIAATDHSQVVQTWIGTSRGTDGKTAVTFVWQPVDGRFGQPARVGAQPARVMLTAAAATGAPYFRGTVPSGPSRVTFQAAPGPLDLRLTVQGSGGQVLDFNNVSVQVPDFTKPQVALSTPAVYGARTAYEFNQLTRDPHAVPTASRIFSHGDQLLVRFEAYGPGGTQPAVTAELLNRGGDSMASLPVTPGTGGQADHVD
ncbi:MAG TPA: VWA domain-containing protein, partial [Vicinamibacterales bacterium]|nr:VWA domain-containing protein [Vicinamibacterales bacterium]